MEIPMQAALCAIIGFIVSAVSGPLLIPVLRKLKFGQQILEVGPNWHKSKAGTPTMGGIIFILGVTVVSLIFIRDLKGLFVALFALSCGLIGFLDDYIKVVKKRNLGLSAMWKVILMLLVSTIFSVAGIELGVVKTTLWIPFTEIHLELSYYISILLVFMMIGFINAVNLTDGIDGLAGSVTFVVSLFFTLASMVALSAGMTAFSAGLCGALCGFLIYNLHPAKVFMGDTGSLFLGGAVIALAILNDMPLMILIVGIVYLIEAFSVMLQVSYFKLTKGKRIFKMTPIHHHFELSGYSENRIVLLFSAVTLVGAVIAFLSLV
ncbi:MAG: phospho-N-acetylmuramoyl-pentapeptide-transferase [Clostridia bacterium]|nr:phospho-N-acetylmuramoyl-pentapeptide-transferase [Clostridia bacterium]